MVALRSPLTRKKANEASDATVEGEAQRREQRSLPRRVSRAVRLIILTLIGMCLLSGLTSHSEKAQRNAEGASSPQVVSSSVGPGRPTGTQEGAVTQLDQTANPQTPALPAICAPLDINCDLNSAAQWVAQGIQNAIQPVTDAIDRDPGNFISQTPICVSGCPTNDSPYQENTTVSTFVNWSVGVANIAVASLIALGALNIMMARQIGSINASAIAQFLPRIALAVMAANLSMYFLQFFLDLENALSLEVIHLSSLTILLNTIKGILHLNLFSAGLIAFAVGITLGVMNLLLAWQMLVRLALLFILIVLAPLGLLCFGLPQTQSYGRLWASAFVSTVFVQFFQVVALALGGMLASYVSTTGFLDFGQDMTSLFISAAVFFLVLRIPGMLRNPMGPVAEAGPAGAAAVGGAAGWALNAAGRLAEVVAFA